MEQIIEKYNLKSVKSDKWDLVFRTKLLSAEDINIFVSELSSVTNTNWIRAYENNDPKRIVFHKKWSCQHSKINKVGNKRDTDCKAKVDIVVKKVNKNTKKNDDYLKLCPPLQTIISLSMKHNHQLNCADALGMLRVSHETLQQFKEYFVAGLSVPEARRIHAEKIRQKKEGTQNYVEELANSSKNPNYRQVQHIFNTWRNENFGTISNPFPKLEEKLTMYENQGSFVQFNREHPWVILVITPIMKRTHSLTSSREIIFVDSTASCESNKSSLTLLLTVTNAGAVPIAVLIHENQTEDCYLKAFCLLKRNFPHCFGGNIEGPSVFMTDDSAAERNALQSTWSTNTLLLCQFHVAQAQWRWLFSSSTLADDRQRLMRLFQAIMYADSPQRVEDAVANLNKETDYPQFVQKINKFLERKLEWISFYRQHLVIRGNNTNNYAEASIRVLKDIILQRSKAFNIVSLVEFCIDQMETYLKERLLDHAHNRIKSKVSFDIDENINIQQINETLYLVPSKSNNNLLHTVDTYIGVCTCYSGKTGAFCRHQYALYKIKKVKMPNIPILTWKERYALGKLALGKDVPDEGYFYDFKVGENSQNEKERPENVDEQTKNAKQNENVEEQSFKISPYTNEITAQGLCEPSVEEEVASEEEMKQISSEIERLQHLVNGKLPKATAQKIYCALKKVKTEEDGLNFFQSFANMSRKKFSRKIKVQPTSIHRRKSSQNRGHKRIPSGRPVSSKASKRCRKLSINIAANVLNAK